MLKTPPKSTPDARVPAVEAVFANGAWRLKRRTAAHATITDDDRALAADSVNDLLAEMLDRMDGRPEAWRLELMKAAFAEGRTTLGLARAFVERAKADPGRPHQLAGRDTEASVAAVAAAFRIAGEHVAGEKLRRLLVASQALAAMVLGLAAYVIVLIQALSWPSRIPKGARVGIAVHAEAVNRTGHILKVLPDLDPDTHSLIIIGRPQIGLGATKRLLQGRGWRGEVVRCFDLPSAVRGLPQGMRIAVAGLGAIVGADYLPTFRELVASMFRVFLGAAAAAWWDLQTTHPEVVVYGHNGVADTVQLDRAQQRSGTRTVHWMHGVSAGRIYTGVSDVCVFQCGHDARWHDRIGGYGFNTSFPAQRPAFRQGSKGWLVATNFTHPGYTFYPMHGPGHELRLLEMVAQAADRAGVSRGDVVWKPHPVFYQVEPEVRARVIAAIEGYGFQLWPVDDRDFDRAADFETIITTPSGVAVDMLKVGRLPIMVAFHSIDPDHLLSCFPLREGDVDGLLAAVGAARDPVRAQALFDQAWTAIEPGRVPEFDEVVEVTRSSRGAAT